MGLLELFTAMAVLLIGLTALLELCLAATYSNNKNSKDTSATLLAQMVLEQVSSQHPDSAATITLTDCANVAHTVATAGGALPNGIGASLDTNAADSTYAMIDWSQQANTITANYSMSYTDCDTNGRQTVYDVRWNIMTVSANETRLITVSARQLSSWRSKGGGGGLRLALPVTLRGIGGP
jgi:Tfp pilus assembly protein PilV